MMTGKEKLYFLLIRIDDVRQITPSGKPILIDPTNTLNRNYSDNELTMLFIKLEKDEKILKVLEAPMIQSGTFTKEYRPMITRIDGNWAIELMPVFDGYYQSIRNEEGYQEFTGTKPVKKIVKELNKKSIQKIWDVLYEIENKRGYTKSDANVSIPLVHFSKVKTTNQASSYADDRQNVLMTLESDYNAIKVVQYPDKLHENVYLKIGKKYFEVYADFQSKFEAITQRDTLAIKDESTKQEDYVYKIQYSEKSRQILVNNFIVGNPVFDSENEVVFNYLYKNQNRTVKTEELEKSLGEKMKKPIHRILNDLGFSGNLFKAFFSASKSGVLLRNPVTQNDLQELGLTYVKIQEK